jgi:glycosyltransferase involved in cell wall biosynthesis
MNVNLKQEGMNVAFLTTSFPRFAGDYAGVFVYDLAQGVADLGVSVTVLAPHESGTAVTEETEGIRVHRFRYFWPLSQQKVAYGAGIPNNLRRSWLLWIELPLFLLGFFRAARRVVKESDLVHAHWIESAFLALLWCKVYKRPLILSVHRFNPSGRIGRWLYRRVFMAADFVCFNSSYTQQRCRAAFGDGVKGDVVPPGINLRKFSPKWENPLPPILPDEGKPVVFGLGSLLPVKGFAHLVDALPLLLAETDCQVFIGGQGPERDALLQQAKALGVAGSLHLLGRVPTEQVPALMQQAAVFVLPSISHHSGDTESLGMVLVEAMACGTPCVASQTGGIVDIVEDGVNGYLAQPGDIQGLAAGIIRLLQDEEARRVMGLAGRRKVEEWFSVTAVARQVVKLYQDIVVAETRNEM